MDRRTPATGMSSTGVARQSFWFQFVTTPTADTPGTTIILHFNSQRYIFGRVGEGTQRAFIERGIGLRKVQSVFLTGDSSWAHQSGLLGMLLTTADVHANAQVSSEAPLVRARFNIHGPPGTAHMLASARKFIFRTGMPLSVHEYGVKDEQETISQPSWQDENVRVWALPAGLSKSTADDSSDASNSDTMSEQVWRSTDTPMYGLEEQQAARHSIIKDMFDSGWRHDRLDEVDFKDVRLPARIHLRNPGTKMLDSFQCATMSDAPHVTPDTKVLVRQPWPGSRWGALPDRKNLPHKAVSYIVRGYTQRGVFEKAKAIELGLKPGPIYKRLSDGHSVQTEDGRVITPGMVLGSAKPGRGIAVIDLPHKSFISALLNRPEWSDPEIMEGVESFCWLTNGAVLEDPQVQDFIRSKSHIQHVFASPEVCPNYLAMDASAASTIRLSRLSRDHFPIPVHDNVNGIGSGMPRPGEALSNVAGLSGRLAERGLTIQIEPRYQIQEQQVVAPLNTHKVIQEIPAVALDLARNFPVEASDTSTLTTGVTNVDEPEIVTLGTGSAVPSKYRNVSATLLKMPGYGYYLFDCGENTLGQLKRMYEAETLNEILSDMRMIWISHLHADHHLGTLSLLEAVKRANKEKKQRKPFALVADEAMIDFVRDMAGRGRSRFTAGTIHHLVCQAGRRLKRKDTRGQLSEIDDDYLSSTLHIRALLTTWVSHCAGAQAISVEFMNGFKISYSGDCRPSKNFARIGADSDVLIHEATFEDDLEGDAYAKKHSTTSEALGVAAQMRAKNVILTHFSQRYQKIPVMTHIKRPDEIHFEEGNEESGPPEPVEGDATPVDAGLGQEGTRLSAQTVSQARSVSSNILGQMNVCIAFDLMRTRVSQIKDMHKLYPAIEALFESEQKVNSEATAEEKNEAINRSKVKGQKNINGIKTKQSKKIEKRKSESDGDGQDEKISKRVQRNLKHQQRDQKSREEGANTLLPNIRKTSTPDTAGSRHVDLLDNQVDGDSLGPIMDLTSQVDRTV